LQRSRRQATRPPHTTRRRHDLAFRAGTALFGHLGVEWNLLELTAGELDALAAAIAVHKRFRPLLHGGDTVRFDTDAVYVAHGVYAPDRSEALVSFAVVATAPSLTPPRLMLPGLDPARRYRVTDVALSGGHHGLRRGTGPLEVTLTGSQLASVGVQLPSLHPENLVLLHVQEASDTS
jgi:alpha-galactosidase